MGCKIMIDLTENEKVDRLPILVSTMGDQKLLEIPKLATGTGQVVTQAVYNSIKGMTAGEFGMEYVFRYNELKYRTTCRGVYPSQRAIGVTPLTLRLPA